MRIYFFYNLKITDHAMIFESKIAKMQQAHEYLKQNHKMRSLNLNAITKTTTTIKTTKTIQITGIDLSSSSGVKLFVQHCVLQLDRDQRSVTTRL